MPFSARPLHTCMNHLRRIVDKHLPSKLFIKSNNAKKKKTHILKVKIYHLLSLLVFFFFREDYYYYMELTSRVTSSGKILSNHFNLWCIVS